MSLEGAHRGLLGRFGVVPAADVERAMGREEAKLVGSGRAHVAGLAAAAGPGLLGSAFDGNDDVAEMPTAARR